MEIRFDEFRSAHGVRDVGSRGKSKNRWLRPPGERQWATAAIENRSHRLAVAQLCMD